MKKLWNKLINDIFPGVLGIVWVVAVFCASVGFLFWSIKYMFRMMGVL